MSEAKEGVILDSPWRGSSTDSAVDTLLNPGTTIGAGEVPAGVLAGIVWDIFDFVAHWSLVQLAEIWARPIRHVDWLGCLPQVL